MKTKFNFFAIGLMTIAAVMLTGCGVMKTDGYLTGKRDTLMVDGKPAAYVDGFVDGCSSGMRMAGDRKFKYVKDNTRADNDALYAKGWDDGQICCRNEALVMKQGGGSSYEEERRRRIKATSKADEAEMREIWEQLRK